MAKLTYVLLIIALCSGSLTTLVPAAHAEFREKGTALIDRKGPNVIMFDGHSFKHFVDPYMMVSSRTHFYDEAGQPISLSALKIPCQVRIEYRKHFSITGSEAISVHVDSYPDDRPGDTQWNLPTRETPKPQ